MVASGELGAIEQLSRLAKAEGIAGLRLPVSNAFHCSLMSPAAEKLARQTPLPDRLLEPEICLFSCMDGREISAGHDLHKHFVRQVTAQVDFMALVESLAGCSDILVEVGPGRVLSGLVDAIAQNGGPSLLADGVIALSNRRSECIARQAFCERSVHQLACAVCQQAGVSIYPAGGSIISDQSL